MPTGWMITGGVVAFLTGALLWWMWYNALLTMPRFPRRFGIGAGAARAAPILPGWLRGWLLRALVVFAILGLMAGVDSLSHLLFGYGLSDVGEWIDDLLGRAGAKTVLKTLWQPLPALIIAAVVVALLWVFVGRRIAVGVAMIVIAIAAISFFTPTRCWSKDAACLAAQKRVADAKAAEEQQKADELARQEAVARAQAEAAIQQARAEAAGGAQCLDVTHTGHTFGTTPDESSVVNPKGKCALEIDLPPDACVYQQAHRSSKRHGPFGNCPEAVPFTAPQDIERVWSAGAPFVADYELKPRKETSTFRH